MQIYASEFISHLQSKDVKYTHTDENVYKIVFGGDNLNTIPVYVFFDDDDDPYVQFKCWDIANFNGKKEFGIEICNTLNKEYRWVKFYIDNDNDVVASIDAVVNLGTCGEECLSLVRRVARIVDGAYPQIAKARWS